MNTKLTLRMNKFLIEKAKRNAKARGRSLSSIVEDYLKIITKSEEDNIELPPNVKALSGILANSDLDEKDYKKYLEEKYL